MHTPTPINWKFLFRSFFFRCNSISSIRGVSHCVEFVLAVGVLKALEAFEETLEALEVLEVEEAVEALEAF